MFVWNGRTTTGKTVLHPSSACCGCFLLLPPASCSGSSPGPQRGQPQAANTDNRERTDLDRGRKMEGKQLQDNKKAKSESIKIQKQLTSELTEDIEELWEETQQQRDEIQRLKIQTHQQQQQIDRLTTEKHEQHSLIQRLKLEIQKTTEELQEHKCVANQEKTQASRIQAEIQGERERRDRVLHPTTSERRRLETVRYETGTSRTRQTERRQAETDRLLSAGLILMGRNKNVMLQIKNMNELTETTIVNLQREIKRNQRDILQHRDLIRRMKETLNLKLRSAEQRRENASEDESQEAAEIRRRQAEEKASATVNNVKLKLRRLQEEMETLWDVLEDTEQKKLEDVQSERAAIERMRIHLQTEKDELERDRRQAEDQLEDAKRKIRDMEVISSEIEMKKKELNKMIRKSQRKKQETGKMNKHTGRGQQTERWTESSPEDTFQDVHDGGEEQSEAMRRKRAEPREEKSRESEVEKRSSEAELQQVERRLDDTMTSIQTLAHMKSSVERAAAEIRWTQDGTLRTRENVATNREHIRKCKDKLVSIKTWVKQWRLTETGFKNTFSPSTSKEMETHQESSESHALEGPPTAGHQTEVMMNASETEEVQRQISKLKEQEEKMKHQIQYAMKNMQEKHHEIKMFITEINHLQSQTPIREIPVWVTENVAEAGTEQDKEKPLRPSEESSKTEVDGGTPSTDMQRVMEEVHTTQQIIKSLNLELENEAGVSFSGAEQQKDDGEIQGFLHDMKHFQELLRGVQLSLQEESKNMKSNRTAERRKERKLDRRLERTLRERDELEILRMKTQAQIQDVQEKFEKMARFKSTMEKMTAKIGKMSEDMHFSVKESEMRLNQLEDIARLVTITKHKMEKSSDVLKMERRAELSQYQSRGESHQGATTRTDHETTTLGLQPGFKSPKEVKPTAQREDQTNQDSQQIPQPAGEKDQLLSEDRVKELVKTDSSTDTRLLISEAEKQQLSLLKEDIERQQLELNNTMQIHKRQMKEIELLNSEMERKRKDGEQIFRKSMRKKAECEEMLHEIQQEKKTLRKETRKRKRQLEQRLAKTMRERDELEVLRIKLKREREELAVEKKQIKEWKIRTEQQHPETQPVERFGKEDDVFLHRSKINDSIIYLQNIEEEIHGHLETMRKEVTVFENVNVSLGRQREGLKAMATEKTEVKNKLSKTVSALKQWKGEIRQQQQELQSTSQRADQERRMVEVMKSELEQKRRENKMIIRISLKNERAVKKTWNAVQQEKRAFRRKIQKKMKEVDQRLEKIMKERDELEIMFLKLQREKDGDQMGSWNMQDVQGRQGGAAGGKTEATAKRELQQNNGKDNMEGHQAETLEPKYNQEKRKHDRESQSDKELYTHKGSLWEDLANVSSRILTEGDDATSQRTQQVDLEKQDLEMQREQLEQDKLNLDQMADRMKKDKQDMEVLMDDIHKQTVLMEQEKEEIKEEKDQMEKTRSELQTKTEHVNSLLDEINREKATLKELSLQVQSERQRLDAVVKEIFLKEKALDDQLREASRQTQELQTMKNKVLAERDELQTLRNNVAWKNQEAEAAQKAINEEKEELSQKKSDIDQEIQKLLNDRDQLEEQGAELQRRENQVRNEMQSVQTMILTLQRLGKKTLEDVKKKMDNLNQDMDKTLRLQNELEQQIADADGKKILVENYNEIIKSLWEDLANVSSRILTEGDDATSQRTQQVDLEKQDLEMQRVQLEQDRLNLDQMADRMKKDKQDMEVLMDDIHKVILVEENNESQNLVTMDVENDNAPDDERKVLYSKTGRMEIQPHPLTPTHDLQPTMINFLGCFTSNVKQLHQKINQILNVSEDIVKERSESMSHLMSRFASVLNLMEKLTFEINCCHDVIKQQKSDMERRQCDKAIQTDVVVTDLFPSPGVEKHSSDRLERKLQFFDRQQQSLLLASENKKLEDALKFQASQTSAEDEASDQDMSKRHLLRKMWKNTNMERQEINQMKSRGLEMRNNLEERLKVINHSVRRTLLHKENTVGGKSSLDQIPHKDIEQGHKQPSEKYSELQQLKLILLSDIEKLHIREKLSRTITTCDQANQTVLGDISMTSTRAEQAQSLTSDPISREEIRAEDSAEGTAAGFLCQLCNYCCSTCCKQRHLKK